MNYKFKIVKGKTSVFILDALLIEDVMSLFLEGSNFIT